MAYDITEAEAKIKEDLKIMNDMEALPMKEERLEEDAEAEVEDSN